MHSDELNTGNIICLNINGIISTALFVMGFDGAVEFWNGHSDLFQMVLITADGMYVTPELEIESGRNVTVLEAAP